MGWLSNCLKFTTSSSLNKKSLSCLSGASPSACGLMSGFNFLLMSDSDDIQLNNKKWILTKDLPKIIDKQFRLSDHISLCIELVHCGHLKSNDLVVSVEMLEIENYFQERVVNGGLYDFQLGETIPARGYGVVLLAGKEAKYKVGSYVIGELGAQSISVVQDHCVQMLYSPPKVELGCALGFLGGHNGILAYIGMNYVLGRPSQGQTVVVSAANGEVGLIACQLAANYGCNVIGLVPDLDIKFQDIPRINWSRTKDFQTSTPLSELCPNGIDFVFHCGNRLPKSVFVKLNENAKIVFCSDTIESIPITTQLIALAPKKGSYTAFCIEQYANKFKIAKSKLIYHYLIGNIKYYQVSHPGIENFKNALEQSQKGSGFGKIVVQMRPN